MSEQQADKQASDAIVAGVAFYAAALARAAQESAGLKAMIAVMVEGTESDRKNTHSIRIECEKLQLCLQDANETIGIWKAKFESTEQALKTEQAKCRNLESDAEVTARHCDELCNMAVKTGRPALLMTEALKVAKDAIDEYIVNHPPAINKRTTSES